MLAGALILFAMLAGYEWYARYKDQLRADYLAFVSRPRMASIEGDHSSGVQNIFGLKVLATTLVEYRIRISYQNLMRSSTSHRGRHDLGVRPVCERGKGAGSSHGQYRTTTIAVHTSQVTPAGQSGRMMEPSDHSPAGT